MRWAVPRSSRGGASGDFDEAGRRLCVDLSQRPQYWVLGVDTVKPRSKALEHDPERRRQETSVIGSLELRCLHPPAPSPSL
jgi:hypothetical protein